MTPQFIPSPPISGIPIGPFTLHFYALSILTGILVAAWLSVRRWRARGGSAETLEGVLVPAVLFGIVGARIYHVITDYELYFGPGKNPWKAFAIWEGGLGVWGAVALGAVGAWLGCRRTGARFAAVADVVAPGIAIAQALGRLGNWFNQELFGRPTTLPWGLEIAPQYRPAGYEQYATFHPTFLYEIVWCLALSGVLLWVDHRFRIGRGKLFWVYVAGYTFGRFWIERLRIDTVNHVGGWRLNEYTSIIVFALAVVAAALLFWRRPGREDTVEQRQPGTAAAPAAGPGSEPVDGQRPGAEASPAEAPQADAADTPGERDR